MRVRAERLAWRSLSVALAALRPRPTPCARSPPATAGNGPYPPAIDLLALVAYLLLYVAMVGLIRARVPRFHPSMWLDGVIGALGTTSLGVAFLIGPYLHPADGRAPVALINLAMPVMDVLLLALLVAVGSILGLRMDRSLLRRHRRRCCCVLAGDVVLFARMVEGTYVDGGPTELLWLVGICFAALAAPRRRVRRPPQTAERSRVGWRLLALPLICNLASLFVLAAGWGDALPSTAAWLAIGCVRRRDRPHRGHLPRGAGVQRGQAAGAHRRADRAGQPPRPARARPAGARRRRPPGARPRCCCSTSTASRRSTTASATTPATTCSARSARGCSRRLRPGRRAGPARRRRVRRPAARRRRSTRPRRGPSGCASWSCSRSRSRASGCTSASASASPPRRCPAATRAGAAALRRRRDVRARRPAREGVHVYVPDPHGGSGDRLRTMEELRTALDRRPARRPPAAAGRPAPTGAWSASRRWSAGSTRPAGCSPRPTCCPPRSRPACCARSPTRCWSWP